MHDKKFNENLAKIHALELSMVEKDLVIQAYYNHFHNIPIKSEASAILRKHHINFSNGEVLISKSIQDRQDGYRKILSKDRQPRSSMNRQNDLGGIYARSFAQTQPREILYILNNANVILKDCEKLLFECKELLDICFTKSELSYSMIINIIDKTQKNAKNSIQALQNYLDPFMDVFSGLNVSAKNQILTQANNMLDKLQTEKNLSADLCIKLSDIRAKNALKDDAAFANYLKVTIDKLGKYADI